MTRKLLKFFKSYKQFGLTLLSVLVALPLDIAGQDSLAHIILAISATANVVPLLWDMIQDLRAGKYGVDILAATAIITSLVMGEYWAGIIIVLMLTGGESLEDYAQQRAKAELNALLAGAPKKAHLLRGRKEIEVLVDKLQVGDKVVIRAGEMVPADAVILEGTASFDESSITGEAAPGVKKPGEELLSGSINLDGSVTARVLRTAEDSQFEQIVKLVKAATGSRAPFVRLADRYSIPFTIISFGIAIAAWVLSGESIRFLEVLVVATPCPLILAAPIALISGMSRSAKQGIIVKTGGALERLATIKTMAFDKTGTLTEGKLKVDKVTTYFGINQNEALGLAAALEQKSNHLLAKSIVTYAQDKKIQVPRAKEIREIAGQGVLAHIGGKEIFVGRLSNIEDQNIETPKNFDQTKLQQTAAFVAIDNRLAAIITFKDVVRAETKSTLARLYDSGIKRMVMVTGDNKAAATAIAKQVGITDIYSEALPADKLKIVEGLQPRTTAFVGDGVNDAPVLAASDIGVALGAKGAAAASESADVVIMLDNLGKVADAVAIAKRTLFIAKQSILIGIFISIGLMLIFSTGKFKPVYGAFAQEVVDVIVIFNALRAHSAARASVPH